MISDATTGTFFEGKLLYGTYLIRETETPAGYSSLGGDIKLTVSKDNISVVPAFVSGNPADVCGVENDNITIHIVNIAGVVLPSTGGPGTTLLYLLGLMLTALAGAGLVMKQRRRSAAQTKQRDKRSG